MSTSDESTSSEIPERSKESTKKLRVFPKIPVFIVENHNDVLELIYKCFQSRYLPFKNNLMIHYDSHPDLCINRTMIASEIYHKQLLLDSCSIENWICPMLYAGHIDEVLWVKAEWCSQIASGTHKIVFGDYENKIRTSSTLDYFLTDGCYEPEELLENKKAVTLHVSEMQKDFKEIVEKADKGLILDIDLDFFSTHNPFLAIYPKSDTYKKLDKIFYIEKNYSPDDLTSVAQFVKIRNAQLDFFESVFNHLYTTKGSLEKFPNEDHKYAKEMVLIQELVESLITHYDKDEVEWSMLFDAGCTCDDIALPHHETTTEELKILFVDFEASLRTLPKAPTIITIARSSLDDYTPVEQVDFIQESILDILRRIFGETVAASPALWYKNDLDIDVMELLADAKPK